MGTKASKLNNHRLHIRISGKEQKKRWYEFCEDRGMTISELVRDAVESVINPPEDVKGSRELREEIALLNEKNRKMEQELQVRNMALENCKAEIDRLQMQEVINDDDRINRPNPKIINILMSTRRPWSDSELFIKLGINQGDVQGMKVLGTQLRLLEDYGLVENHRGKWRWVNE